MAWGIIVYESAGLFYSFIMADDIFYDGLMKKRSGIGKFIVGKKGIGDRDIDIICEKVSGLVEDVNVRKSSLEEAKGKLETILNNK